MASTPRLSVTETLNQFSVDEVIMWLNAQNIGDQLFVCFECGDLVRGDPIDLCTTSSGDERSFCSSCVITCPGCEYDYAPSMAWFHEDCSQSDYK